MQAHPRKGCLIKPKKEREVNEMAKKLAGMMPGMNSMMGGAPMPPKPMPMKKTPVMKQKGMSLAGFAPGPKKAIPKKKKVKKVAKAAGNPFGNF